MAPPWKGTFFRQADMWGLDFREGQAGAEIHSRTWVRVRTCHLAVCGNNHPYVCEVPV